MINHIGFKAKNSSLPDHLRDEQESLRHEQIGVAQDEGLEGSEDGSDNEMEKSVVEMNMEDEAYLQTVQKRNEEQGPGVEAGEGSVKSDNVYDIPRTGSPEAISPTAARLMRRTVTIDETTRMTMEKESGLSPDLPTLYPTHPAPGRRRRSISFARTSTSKSFSSFSSFISDSWDNRHNPSQPGFWAAAWKWVVGGKTEGETGPREGDPDYIPPKYRWTPILSGLLQPFSILLEIPGLTEHWYVRTENNVPVVYQANPAILDVGLAISMACAIIANVALISRFLERRVLASTITTIVGLSIHDLINIIAVTIFGIVHRVDDGFTYSEAYFLCVCSTVASMFTNATLIYDLIRTKEFRHSGSGLTPKQRSLVIIVMVLLVYIAIGALSFNFLLPDIPFQNALYFTVVSIETIGFGDILPKTLGAKIFLLFYAPLGILNLAVTVGTARDTIVESWNAAYRRRRHEMLKRHRLRKQQRAEEAIHRAAIERQLDLIGVPLYVTNKGGGVRGGSKSKKLNVKALSIDQLNAAESQAMSEIASKSTSNSDRPIEPSGDGAHGQEYRQAEEDARKLRDELAARSLVSEDGYREFQERMAKEEKMENLVKVSHFDVHYAEGKFGFAFSLFLIFWIKWSWFIGLYFCFVSFTTIGYGEVAPQTPAGRAFFIIWAIFGVATVTLLVAVLTEVYANRYKSALVKKGAKRATHAIKDHGDKMLRRAAPNDEQEVDRDRVARLPYDIIDVIKTWHQHAAASHQSAVEGRESAGERLTVDRMMEEQRLSGEERAELAAVPGSRRMLFWNGYERAVHNLLAVAEVAIRRDEARETGREAAAMAEEDEYQSKRRTNTLPSINESRLPESELIDGGGDRRDTWDIEKTRGSHGLIQRRISR